MPVYTWDGLQQRQLRRSAGIDAATLAREIGRSATAILDYERGRAIPPLPAAANIAARLGRTVDDLLINNEEVASDVE